MSNEHVKDNNKTLLIIGAVAVVAIIIQMAQPNEKPNSPSPSAETVKASGPSDSYRMTMAMGDVQKRLRDPSSAEFGPMYVRTGVVCGTVNSKNGFGGMTGQQRFMSRLGSITAFANDVEGNGFNDAWASVCGS